MMNKQLYISYKPCTEGVDTAVDKILFPDCMLTSNFEQPGNEHIRTHLILSWISAMRGLPVKKCSAVLMRDFSVQSRIQMRWQPCNNPLKSLETGRERGFEGWRERH